MPNPSVAPDSKARPEISVYWKPGCSSCLKLKEFVEEQGIVFESVNIDEQPERMDEITAAGLRSIPVVRCGARFSYAQSLDDIASFLGVSRRHTRLPSAELLERWEEVLERARVIARGLGDDMLARRAISMRDRSVKDLCAHIFQVADGFMKTVDEGLSDTRTAGRALRAQITTRDELLAYIDATLDRYSAWRRARDAQLPSQLTTYYGDQPAAVVLERGVWHSAQHARQLDVIAAGNGAEFQIPPELYEGLPMPRRLWA